MSKNEKNARIASEVLAAVGGEQNITQVTHCMTRLRFNLKDASIPQDDTVKAIDGVIGLTKSGGQYQVIIGQNVDKVYQALIENTNLKGESMVSDEVDKPKEKRTWKTIGSAILDGLAGSITPAIPVMMAASIFKMLTAVLGPDMLNILSPTSDLYVLFTFVGDAGFYFFPVILGYTAAKKFGVTPVLGMLLGAIMIHPTLVGMAAEGNAFTVYGIPCNVQNYASTVFPIIMSVWVMSYVEKFFKRILPDALKVVFSPTLTIAVMLPIALCALGPLGSFLGTWVGEALLGLDSVAGFLAIAIIAALWQFLVMSGMHTIMITSMILIFAQSGKEGLVSVAAVVSSIAVSGMCLGAFLRIRNKEDKSLSFGYLVAAFIGGVSEPALYGLGMKFKRPFIGLLAGGLAGGLYAGLTGVISYTLVPVASFLCMTGFAGGSTTNLINGLVACGIGFIVAAVVTYFFGFAKDEPAIEKK
ncbi:MULTISPECIES: PTS transporter subunit EIIC [unclassified Breznakia]|uniref:PTS transporter subunit EIIC n=1 Tax=unclassified Breznakia TaxID=2623764 RepID=UPI002474EE84|nr:MULTISPECIES: PTS transporter subunit EIIC [unclassified Breznakia]MDH6368104.1 PTS system beta-glucosides-specific IIC component [Breznakia sp. PH1-1]MDH6405193.1 PTS system beta-glucosides-specific IIC component [Breznakia sp. PF1-11]MDH6412903.1 PTS system beta-glucosides-specific IIC component [Breznakia sp. PFB1-11]MDH6415265.1 PTS system beta-glucosides-specific IIC component [Breznakia sp. PFB1-14]MDH6417574.1 PTS system beta-glucosides-specific IIC component [Breznakia sp. PFB1-4]